MTGEAGVSAPGVAPAPAAGSPAERILETAVRKGVLRWLWDFLRGQPGGGGAGGGVGAIRAAYTRASFSPGGGSGRVGAGAGEPSALGGADVGGGVANAPASLLRGRGKDLLFPAGKDFAALTEGGASLPGGIKVPLMGRLPDLGAFGWTWWNTPGGLGGLPNTSAVDLPGDCQRIAAMLRSVQFYSENTGHGGGPPIGGYGGGAAAGAGGRGGPVGVEQLGRHSSIGSSRRWVSRTRRSPVTPRCDQSGAREQRPG